MRETQRIADQLRRAFDGDAWSGPSLHTTLAGITAAQAAAHPLPGVHSIGELVRHLTTWAGTVAWRVEQRQSTPLTQEDWPAFAAAPDESAWQQARQELQSAHQRLVAAAEALPDDALEARVLQEDGAEVSLYVVLHGSAQHYLYHAGQIALLRKFL
ncbi:DinB family protein [Hymenobacter psychrotolerans]|uniref:DinB superfamily protein n=1 Tax=Hymenobacter psychrotolerans DSM 18569 TaxID=1121959 RepID=A0A1M6RGL4_9BACT|nr:DinB family protein [Hymenobacter psychrotolerans]SHK31533.1 DinB superfamily protein [Hymenobacter psychrotolerans DSM 18569]